VTFHQQCGNLRVLFASIHQSCNTHSRNPIPWKHALVFLGLMSQLNPPVLMAKPYWATMSHHFFPSHIHNKSHWFTLYPEWLSRSSFFLL
jgi:hypothetical protein